MRLRNDGRGDRRRKYRSSPAVRLPFFWRRLRINCHPEGRISWPRAKDAAAAAQPPTSGVGRGGPRGISWRARLRPGLFSRANAGYSVRPGTAIPLDRPPSLPARDCAGRNPILPRSFRPSAVACPKNHVARDGRRESRATWSPRAISSSLPNLSAMKRVSVPARRRNEDGQA